MIFAAEEAEKCSLRRVWVHQGLSGGKFYRDVKLCTIGEGTSEIQRLVIGRLLLME